MLQPTSMPNSQPQGQMFYHTLHPPLPGIIKASNQPPWPTNAQNPPHPHPNFENIARSKEVGTPHFTFLFGSEPDSAAAIVHEYFQYIPGPEIRRFNSALGADNVPIVGIGFGMRPSPSSSRRLAEQFPPKIGSYPYEVTPNSKSKWAFKTIVKKTVDKVARAVPSHHIPKSQVKINQYVDSSQRKLTKLVMGYVDKDVKILTTSINVTAQSI